MNRLIIVYIFTLFTLCEISSQNYFDLDRCIIQDENGQAISHAIIRGEGSILVAQSDDNGVFSLDKTPSVLLDSFISIHHLSYRDTTVLLKSIIEKKVIVLTHKVTFLDEVNISEVAISKESQVLALKVISNVYKKLIDNYSDSIYSFMGEFSFLIKEEFSNDTIRYIQGLGNVSLPLLIFDIQRYYEQKPVILNQTDYRRSYLRSIVDKEKDVDRLLPLYPDFEYSPIALLGGLCEMNFSLKKKNLDDNLFFIEDTIVIENEVYVKICSTPKKRGSGFFVGEFIVNTRNYHIKELKLNLVRHEKNKAVFIKSRINNGVILYPVYDQSIEMTFTSPCKDVKSRIKKAVIISTSAVQNKSKTIDSERLISIYEISNFALNSSSLEIKTTRNNKPSKMQKKIMEKTEKLIEELSDNF